MSAPVGSMKPLCTREHNTYLLRMWVPAVTRGEIDVEVSTHAPTKKDKNTMQEIHVHWPCHAHKENNELSDDI
jgi:hypothetical protein